MKTIPVVLLLFSLSLATHGAERCGAGRSIVGVWKVVEIATDYESPPEVGAETSRVYPNKDPLPSQIIFTRRHYSMIWSAGTEAMRAFSVRWQPTDGEKLRRFGEVGMNTGTYEVEDGILQVRPSVARVPEFMGGSMTYACKWDEDNLILTLLEEYTFDGVPAPWADESSGRIHLILGRLKD